MSYGIAISTIFGFKEVTTQKVPLYIAEVTIPISSGQSGSFTAPSGVTSSNGFAFTKNPYVFVSISATTVNWQFAGSGSFTFWNPSDPDWSIIIGRYQ